MLELCRELNQLSVTFDPAVVHLGLDWERGQGRKRLPPVSYVGTFDRPACPARETDSVHNQAIPTTPHFAS